MSCVSGIQLKVTSCSPYRPIVVAPSMLAIRLPCVSITPFGSLVEPDENWMNARSDGSGRVSLPGREISVIDSTRKQREARSLIRAVSPASAASVRSRSRFFESVYRYGSPSLRATRSSFNRCSSLMPTASGTGTMPPAQRRPEAVQELLVVAEKDDDLVAALRTDRLQVVQDPERAGMYVRETDAPLGVLTLHVGDDAIDPAIRLQDIHQSLVPHRSSTVIMRLERGRRLICASSSIGPTSARVRRKRRNIRLQVHQHLEHRDVLADAMARAHGKRDVSESVAFLGIHAGEALRPKLLRIAPEFRVPMQHVGADEHIGARRRSESRRSRRPRSCGA